eukprot:4932351-Pleurochrysis_carterae.AAC.1
MRATPQLFLCEQLHWPAPVQAPAWQAGERGGGCARQRAQHGAGALDALAREEGAADARAGAAPHWLQ